MNTYFQKGLLAALVISLTACGGGSDKKTPRPVDPPPSSASSSSVANSSGGDSSASSTSSIAPSSSSAGSVDASSSSSLGSSIAPSSSSGSSSSQGTPLTGVFVDSAVAGIGYRTASHHGVTSPLGEYLYQPGETVTFFIGNLELPPVPAKGVVTPADIAQAAHDDDAAVAITQTNILQILQTLDKDGNPANGIQIPASAAEQFRGDDLPSVTEESFDTAIVAYLPDETTLVGEEAANAHFNATLRLQLVGSWIYDESNGTGPSKRNVLSFIDISHYVIIHEHDDEDSQLAGTVEFGSYELDLEQNKLHVRVIEQSDEYGGLYDEDAAEDGVVTHTIALDGTTLTLGTPLDGQAVFTRVSSATNPRVGGWANVEEVDDGYLSINVMTYLSDSEYVIAHTNNEEAYVGEEVRKLSGEFGTYSLEGGVFQVLGATVDTDGDGGLYNKEDPSDQANETLEITPWGDLIFTDDNEGSFALARLGNFAADLRDYDEEGALGTISAIRDSVGFTTQQIAGKQFDATLPLADGGESVFAFSFNSDVNDDGEASGVIVASQEGEEDVTVDIRWTLNSAGTLIATFDDDGESFTLALGKLLDNTADEEYRVLLSLESEEESSLWETKLIRNH